MALLDNILSGVRKYKKPTHKKVSYRRHYDYDVDDDMFAIMTGLTVDERIKQILQYENPSASNAKINRMLNDEFKSAVDSFNTNAFRRVKSHSLDDFLENAEGGEKSTIKGTTYYKVRNPTNFEYYTIYFTSDDDVRFV